jgi:hypothetical protein
VKTRYELVIDLGEHESAVEAASGVMLPTHASWHVRPSLPVIATCKMCSETGVEDAGGDPRFCYLGQFDIDPDAAPPQDCPLRSKGAP